MASGAASSSARYRMFLRTRSGGDIGADGSRASFVGGSIVVGFITNHSNTQIAIFYVAWDQKVCRTAHYIGLCRVEQQSRHSAQTDRRGGLTQPVLICNPPTNPPPWVRLHSGTGMVICRFNLNLNHLNRRWKSRALKSEPTRNPTTPDKSDHCNLSHRKSLAPNFALPFLLAAPESAGRPVTPFLYLRPGSRTGFLRYAGARENV